MTKMLHATAVSYAGRAALLRGASGSGKSSLALQLIALGCGLVADDQVRLSLQNGRLIAQCPAGLPAKIEVRGVGLLPVQLAAAAEVRLLVDLDHTETARLPEPRTEQLLGRAVPVLRNVDASHFPAAILLYLQGIPESF